MEAGEENLMASAIDTLFFDGVTLSFGGLKAVSNVRFQLKSGELVGLIGPNGAGKTTIFNLITGVYPANSGTIFLENATLQNVSQSTLAKMGISRTFQNIRLFAEMTVLENVLVSFHMRTPYSLLESVFRLHSYFEAEIAMEERGVALLEIMGLKHRVADRAGSLSYGDQRRLEIARALATKPKLLLLDEPAAGLNSTEKVALMHTIKKIRDHFQLTVLLIEHDMKLIMGICERILVLDHGELIAEGTPREIQTNKKVIEAYLGVE